MLRKLKEATKNAGFRYYNRLAKTHAQIRGGVYRTTRIRIVRDGAVLFEGTIGSLINNRTRIGRVKENLFVEVIDNANKTGSNVRL